MSEIQTTVLMFVCSKVVTLVSGCVLDQVTT